MERRLLVNEIFYSLQGESTQCGRPCVFVRLAGCPLRCTWCDTTYAFHEGRWMEPQAVLEEIAAFPCRLVEVTGGEPLAQPAVLPFLERLVGAGCEVLLETSGAFDIAAVVPGVRRIVDLKTPSSGETARNLWSNLPHLNAGDEVKFVIANREDYVWARDVVRRHALHERCTVLLSPEWGSDIRGDLAAWMLADGLPARFQLQLHKLVWPGVVRGV